VLRAVSGGLTALVLLAAVTVVARGRRTRHDSSPRGDGRLDAIDAQSDGRERVSDARVSF
jgi:hypothetical protein